METRPVDHGPLRLSFLVIAAGIGIGACFASYDVTHNGWLAFVVGARWFGYTLAALFSLPVLGWLLGTAGTAWATWDAIRLEALTVQADPPETRTRSPLLDGALDAMTDAERHIQAGLLLTLEHARRDGGMIEDKIGHAFGRTEHWVWWTSVLALSGLAVKVNGQPTVLPPGKTYFWAISKVRRGEFELPVPLPTTLPPLPVAVAPESAEKRKLEIA
jgi:hypothetical protein